MLCFLGKMLLTADPSFAQNDLPLLTCHACAQYGLIQPTRPGCSFSIFRHPWTLGGNVPSDEIDGSFQTATFHFLLMLTVPRHLGNLLTAMI